MQLETKDLILRKPCAADFDRFWMMINDPVAKKYTGGVTKLSRQERLALFERECGKRFSARGAEFAVIEKASGDYLGYCGFRQSKELSGNEFLYGFCRDCWGKGYATQAARAVLAFLFDTYPHDTYIATTDAGNKASKRVLEKAGFIRTGAAKHHDADDIEIYTLDREGFMAQKEIVPDFGQDASFVRDGHLFRLRAAAIILKDDRVLMVKNERTSYYYSLGGAVRLGETLEEALRREVLEECGLCLNILRLAVIHQNFFVDNEISDYMWHELAFYYLMDYRGEPLTGAAGTSMLGLPETLHWLPLNTYRQYEAHPRFFADLKNILLSPEPVHIVTREGKLV